MLQSQNPAEVGALFFVVCVDFSFSSTHFLIRYLLQRKVLVQTQRNTNPNPTNRKETKDPIATLDNLIKVLLVHIFVVIGFFTRISSPGRGRFI